ncbi:MAG: hypothetical protein WC797_03155 [Candidatus Paceibacterota bacterium]|jgi:hypothetical protein
MILLAASILPFSVSAAREADADNSIYVDLYPQNPSSFSDVAIGVRSYLRDIEQSIVSWSVDGKQQAEGIGLNQISVTTGPVGKTMTISAVISTQSGDQIEKVIKITPADASIVWEAQTYVPPFFKGKALPSASSKIRFVAIPDFHDENGKTIKQSSLSYEWTKNSETALRGVGKYIFDTTIGNTEDEISVKIYDQSKTISVEKTVTMLPYPTKMIVYEDRPLEKTRYENAIGDTMNLSTEETTLRVEPFYISLSLLPQTNFVWQMNGKQIFNGNGNRNRTMTFRQERGNSGESEIASGVGSVLKRFKIIFGGVNF